jgi:hypothetical protein
MKILKKLFPVEFQGAFPLDLNEYQLTKKGKKGKAVPVLN